MVSVQIDCTEVLLKSARTHVRTLNLLSFLVHTRGTPVILALVELLPSALFADHLLVARYEPCKESSVSVCHNSNFDWLIIEAGHRTCPAVWLLVVTRNMARTTECRSVVYA